MRVKTEFQIYERTHRSGNKGWLVSMGTVNGKRKLKSCSTLEEAQLLKAKLEERNALKNAAALSEIDELGKAAIRFGLAKLKPFDASISEAVDFFVKFAKPPKGKLTIQEAMDLFKKEKAKDGLSQKYLDTSKNSFFAPFRDAFENRYMNEVTPQQARAYLHRNSAWSVVTRNTHHRHLRTLYNFLIEQKHATINPFDFKRAKVKPQRLATKIMSVENTEKLLQTALNQNKKAICASMVLVFFCGVRVDEVERVMWEDIRLDAKKPKVDVLEAKNGSRRVNTLPENAILWLKMCRSKGRIAPQNYEKTMQRFRKKVKVPYPQNAARHSFASYHIALFEDGIKTAVMLGHKNPVLLYDTYREVVPEEEAKRYWEIIPECIRKQREEEARLKKEEEDRKAEEAFGVEGAHSDEKDVFDLDGLVG